METRKDGVSSLLRCLNRALVFVLNDAIHRIHDLPAIQLDEVRATIFMSPLLECANRDMTAPPIAKLFRR
jgi:hypothetical protein